jgi:hypothetical protein
MRGYLPYVQGKYKLKIEDAGNETDILSGAATIVKTFSKDNIVGNITYTGIERNSKYTQVTVKYVDPDNKWSVQEVTYPEDEDTRQFYVSFDGGRENSTEITFSGCTNYAIAKDFARMIFNKSRFQDSLSFRCDATGFDLEPGDNIHVNANILKFSGEDKLTRDDIPWRIVSIKLNNDYTFDIGAVRNPDFLYPHTRVGEIDVVLPPYVPKGAEIYFPKVQRSLPYGLVPPTRSPHPGLPPELVKPVDLDDPTLPVVPGLPPTNPTGVDGGGVGGIDSPLNDINNPNNPPPPPPPVYKFDDIIDIINVSYSATPGSSATDATFTFIQPDHPQYHSIDVYYKIASNQITSYRHVVEDSKRGAGQELTFTLENLLANRSYVVITRVNYSTGDSSQGRSTSYIFPTPGTSTDVNEGVDAVSPGWDLPIADPVNNKDTYIEAISAQTLLTNGNPRNPRQINVTIRQYIAGQEPNDEIIGIDCYYKPSSFTYWYKVRHNFRSSYIQGDDYTFQFPESLGSTNTEDKYDFVFRFVYVDNTQSKYQARIMNCDVETPDGGITYDFDPFEGKQLSANGKELLADFQILTTDEEPIDPPVVDARNFILNKEPRYTINDSTPTPRFRFIVNEDFEDPENLWLGARVTYRSLARGANNEPVILEFLPVSRNAFGQLEFTFPINFEENYEYIITPLVRYQGTKFQTNKSWYGRGAMTRYKNIDYWQVLNFQLEDTNVALRRLSDTRSIDPANPTLQILGFEMIQLDSIGLDHSQCYYRIAVNHSEIPAFQGVKIYRRSLAPIRAINELTSYGYGRWEEITDTRTNTESGDLIYNLRRAVSFTEFNTNNALVNPLYTTSKPLESRTADQFIIVVQADGLASGKAYFLSGSRQVTGEYRSDLLQWAEPEEVDPADYNTFSGASLRNLEDARTAISGTATLINFPTNKTAGGWTLPTPLDGPAVV